MSQPWLVLSVVSVLAMAGCDSGLDVAPVSGTVLLDGEPLVGANVNTQPISTSAKPKPGSGSFGKTDAQGHYSLELVDPPIAGAVFGEHRVTITRAEEQQDDEDDRIIRPTGPRWPARYSDGSLRLTVSEAGTSEADYDLTMKP